MGMGNNMYGGMYGRNQYNPNQVYFDPKMQQYYTLDQRGRIMPVNQVPGNDSMVAKLKNRAPYVMNAPRAAAMFPGAMASLRNASAPMQGSSGAGRFTGLLGGTK